MDYKTIKWSVHDNPQQPGEPCIGLITLNRSLPRNPVGKILRGELTKAREE